MVDISEGGTKRITLTRDFSNRLIWSCTAEEGSGADRAFCIFNKIEGVCHTFPVAYVYQEDCTTITNYGDWEEMEDAIKYLILFGAQGCLSYWFSPPPCVTDCRPQPHWWWQPLGQRGCLQGGV